MATPRINGTLLPVRTKLSTRYDPVKGITVTQEFESAGDNLGGLALQAKNSGMEYTLDANARKSRLVMSTTGAAAGFPEQATSTWQLYTNQIQKDIREHPIAIALGPVVIKKIEAAIEMMKVSSDQGVDEDPLLDGLAQTYEEFTAADGAFPPGTNAKKLLDLLLHGVTSYNVSGYSARASISLPFLFSGSIPGVSPDSLMAALMVDIPVGGADDGELFNWGWRRMGTSRTFSGNNRTEINIEWELAPWAFIYTDVTDLPT